MNKPRVGKITIYYGSGKMAEERRARLDAAANRRGYVNSKGEPELSPVFVQSFEFVNALNLEIEKAAELVGVSPWDYVNQLFTQAKTKR